MYEFTLSLIVFGEVGLQGVGGCYRMKGFFKDSEREWGWREGGTNLRVLAWKRERTSHRPKCAAVLHLMSRLFSGMWFAVPAAAGHAVVPSSVAHPILLLLHFTPHFFPLFTAWPCYNFFVTVADGTPSVI